ncbi:MAG TPA: DUF4185 domain-containing protein [Kineosporiaceae bacterium]|nr:DUF4185 domain-containing protein [Kineosporiaceae bacterium]
MAEQRFRRSDSLGTWEWTTSSSRFPGTNSDMHWVAWSADGDLFTVDDDGQNFGSPWNFANFMGVQGTPPDHTVRLISQFPELVRGPETRCMRYVDGAVAIDDRVYVAAYDYDFDVPGLDPFADPGNDSGVVGLISAHGGVAALMYTDDKGQTWNNVPGPEVGPDRYFLGPRFAGLAFLQYGPGHTNVPQEHGDYVYALSNDGNWETGDHVFLARVPRGQVLDRSAWEFWASPGEGAVQVDRPAWTRDEYAARPVLRDPGRIGHPTMTHVPALDRYLLTYSTDAVPHTFHVPAEAVKETWVKRTELVVLEGPTPWGPWRLLHHEPSWEYPHTPYLPQIPGKWLDDDGLGGWMIFSGDYVIPNCQGDYYGFMTRRFRFARLD